MIPTSNDMRFELTTACNYACTICPRELLTRDIKTMSLELFKELFDKITLETSQYTNLTLSGFGEPLMDKTLPDKLEYALNKKSELTSTVLTNGSYLTPERFKRLNDIGLTSIRVSFYGVDKDSYNTVHGIKSSKMFERVNKNVKEIAKLERKTQIIFTYNITDGNDHCVNEWINQWKNVVDLVEVWKPHNWVDGRDYRTVQPEKLNSCGRPFTGPLQIQVDGTINMCCFDFDGKLELGDLKTHSLKEIFNDFFFQNLRARHETGDFDFSGLICKDCDQRNADKKDVMVYNSKFDIKERVQQTSTTYSPLEGPSDVS